MTGLRTGYPRSDTTTVPLSNETKGDTPTAYAPPKGGENAADMGLLPSSVDEALEIPVVGDMAQLPEHLPHRVLGLNPHGSRQDLSYTESLRTAWATRDLLEKGGRGREENREGEKGLSPTYS